MVFEDSSLASEDVILQTESESRSLEVFEQEMEEIEEMEETDYD
jgi:hypothetical protein